MTTLDKRARSLEVDDTLWVDERPDGMRRLLRGPAVLTSNEDDELAFFAKLAIRVHRHQPKPGASVAMIGLGLGYGLEVLGLFPWGQKDVYELEPTIVAHTPHHGWRVIQGDYRKSLRGVYDVLVFDATDTEDSDLLQRHLAPGGLLLSFETERSLKP